MRRNVEDVLPGAICALYFTRSQVAEFGNANLSDALKGALVKVLDTPDGLSAIAEIEETVVQGAHGSNRLIVSLARPDGRGPVKVPVTRLLDEDITQR